MDLQQQLKEDRNGLLLYLKNLMEAGKAEHVLTIAQSMLYEDQNDVGGLFYAASALNHMNNTEVAYTIMRQATLIRPDRKEIWQNMGHICDKLWRYEEARFCYGNAHIRAPNNPQNLASLASSYIGLGNAAMAKIYAARAAADHTDFGSANVAGGTGADTAGFDGLIVTNMGAFIPNPGEGSGGAGGVCDVDTNFTAGTCGGNYGPIQTPAPEVMGECDATAPQSFFTACGDPSTTPCDNPDYCDGAGVCLNNNKSPGNQCGSPAVECNPWDQCDAAGVCQPVYSPFGSTCGGAWIEPICNPDGCDGAGSEDACRRLVALALERGSADNVSVAAVEVGTLRREAAEPA